MRRLFSIRFWAIAPLTVGALLVTSCASTVAGNAMGTAPGANAGDAGDAPTSASNGTNSSSTPAKSTTARALPGSDERQIKNITEKYVKITNTGKTTGLNGVFCQDSLDRIGDNPEDMPAADPQIELDQYDNITIDGDTAVVEVTISATDQPELGTQHTSIPFVNEDGWKVCL